MRGLFPMLLVVVASVCKAASMQVESNDAAASHRRAVTYEDLLDIKDLGVMELDGWRGVAISPDGTYVALEERRAVVTTNTTDIRWIVVPLARDAPPRDVGSGGERISETNYGLENGYSQGQIPARSSDSKWIVYRAKRNGEVQLWRTRVDGTQQEQISHNAADVIEYGFSSDRSKLFFTVGATRKALQQASREEANSGFLYDERFSPLYGTTKPMITKAYETPVAQTWIIDWSSGAERLATSAEAQQFSEQGAPVLSNRSEPRQLRHSRHGNTMAWLEDLRTNREVGVEPPLTVVASPSTDVAQARACLHPACTGTFKGVWVSDDGREVYFERWERGYHYGALGFYRWSLIDGSLKLILQTTDLIEACSLLAERLICVRETPTHPGDLIALNLHTGAIATVYEPNPEFRRLAFGEVTALTWVDKEGVEGFGHLIKPLEYQAGKRYPLVIVQYISRGFLRGGVGDEYPIHVLSARGFMVLSFHHPEDRELQASSRSWDEVEKRRWTDVSDRRRVLSVLDAGIEKLDRAGLIDTSRIGITGLSAGAESATFALIHSRWKFAAAALSGTFWNPIDYALGGPTMQRKFESWGLKDPTAGMAEDGWSAISLARNATRVCTPIQIQVSDAELLPETETYSALKTAQCPVEMHVFPDEHHIKSQPLHRAHIYRRNVQWLQFWLNGIEEPDPVDAEQYGRWTSLRRQSKQPWQITSR